MGTGQGPVGQGEHVSTASQLVDGATHLSRERIVRAAIAIADAEGLENVHMRRLAGYLGAGTMSLYRYVGNKDELIDLMVEATFHEIPQPDPAPHGWRAGLEYTARRDWELYRRHPWVLRHAMVGSRMRWSHAAAADGERAMSSFDGLGLAPDEQFRILLMVMAYTQGFALIHVNDVELTRRTGATAEQWWGQESERLPRDAMSRDYPRVAAVFDAVEPLPLDLEARFTEGLRGILDGVDALLALRGGAGPGPSAASAPGAPAPSPG
ncbi:MAG TPA: TetR/AcrR family transcriptional regulator [Yinghuangia sp.]|nr:TetR/AcrR family transcriptional regulator [Yinghuangia sp.]